MSENATETTEDVTAPETDALTAEATEEAADAVRAMFGWEKKETAPATDDANADEDEAPADGDAPANDDAPADEQPEAEPSKPRREEVDPEEDPTPAWKRSMIARKERQLERRQAEFEQQRQAFEAREKELQETVAEIRGLATKLTKDPEAAIDDLARMVGRSGRDVIRDLAHRVMHGKPDPKAEEAGVVAELKKEIAELKKEIAGSTERVAKTWQERQRAEFVEGNIADILAVKTDPRIADAFPLLAALPDGKLEAEVRQVVQWAAAERPDLLGSGLPNLARMLESAIEEEHEAVAKARARRQNGNRAPDQGPGEPQGHGSPAKANLRARAPGSPAPANPRKRVPQPVTNGSAARPTGMSPEEAEAAAADALRAGLGFT